MRRQLAWLGFACLGLAGLPLHAQWPQWGGPTRDFHSSSTGLADTWPAGGPPVIWSSDPRHRPFRRSRWTKAGCSRWRARETGARNLVRGAPTRPSWRSMRRRARRSGNIATPPGQATRTSALARGRTPRRWSWATASLPSAQTSSCLRSTSATGKVIWSHDFVKEFKSPELLLRPNVKTGYGCSPIAFGDMILCSVGGPGQSVMAFRQSDGAVVWKSGDFLTSAAAPILIEMDGRPQAVFLARRHDRRTRPVERRILWAHPHDPGNDLNCGTPLFGPDNVLFMSSAYQAGSRAIRLTARGDATDTEELWFTNRVRFMFLSSIRIGDFVYGTTGDFGPAFLTALNVKTGESPWQVRGFARASLARRRRQSDRDERRRRSGAGAPLACRCRDPFADKGLQHHDLDRADAGRNHVVREGQRKDRRAGSWRAGRRTRCGAGRSACAPLFNISCGICTTPRPRLPTSQARGSSMQARARSRQARGWPAFTRTARRHGCSSHSRPTARSSWKARPTRASRASIGRASRRRLRLRVGRSR